MHYVYFLLAIAAGAMMPTQGAVNYKLAIHLQNPLLAAIISFAIGLIALIAFAVFSGVPLHQLGQVKHAPPISWIGGLLGAFFVTAVILTVPKLGVALTFSLLVLGQMIATLPIDHYGFAGVMVRAINWQRITGVLLIIAGVILIRKF
jgi:transporter family-2 protein